MFALTALLGYLSALLEYSNFFTVFGPIPGRITSVRYHFEGGLSQPPLSLSAAYGTSQ